jgi:hypothetical protein
MGIRRKTPGLTEARCWSSRLGRTRRVLQLLADGTFDGQRVEPVLERNLLAVRREVARAIVREGVRGPAVCVVSRHPALSGGTRLACGYEEASVGLQPARRPVASSPSSRYRGSLGSLRVCRRWSFWGKRRGSATSRPAASGRSPRPPTRRGPAAPKGAVSALAWLRQCCRTCTPLALTRLGLNEYPYRSVRWFRAEGSSRRVWSEPWMSRILDLDTGCLLIVDGGSGSRRS